MFENCAGLVVEIGEIEIKLSDPSLHNDQNKARELNKRYSQLKPIVATYKQYLSVIDDIAAAKEFAESDPSFVTELENLDMQLTDLSAQLETLLIPRDPLDDKDVILEIKAGEGGDESALFASDLLRMYMRWADRHGLKAEVIDMVESDLGGYKDVSLAVKARGIPEPGNAPWALLKHEAGVHRVQRVPVTESQGRIHTSAAGVLVYPEAEDVEVEVNAQDLRIDVYRSSGPGGQSVNTTDSAVRITHVPTGIVVSCQNEKSQLQNKESALRILRARLLAAAEEAKAAEAQAARKMQVRTVDRSERVRTYNFPENRLTDHRSNFKSYNLDQILEGDLDGVISSLVEIERAERMRDAGK